LNSYKHLFIQIHKCRANRVVYCEVFACRYQYVISFVYHLLSCWFGDWFTDHEQWLSSWR